MLPAMAAAIVILIIILARLIWRDYAAERRAEDLEKRNSARDDTKR